MCQRVSRAVEIRWYTGDGLTLIPWKLEKCAVWDVNNAYTTANSYILVISQPAGSAVELAANEKRDNYVTLANNHLFVPIAMESFGPVCSEGITFLKELGHL